MGVAGFSKSQVLGQSRSLPTHSYLSADYFRNLYFSNGTFLALTTKPSSFPEQGVDFIFSGIVKEGDPYRKHFAAEEDRFAIMTPKEAMDSGLLQPAAIRKEGISVSQMMRMVYNESSCGPDVFQRCERGQMGFIFGSLLPL